MGTRYETKFRSQLFYLLEVNLSKCGLLAIVLTKMAIAKFFV